MAQLPFVVVLWSFPFSTRSSNRQPAASTGFPRHKKKRKKCSGPHEPRLRHHPNDDIRSTSDSFFLESAHRQFQFDNLQCSVHLVHYATHPASGKMMAFFLIDKKDGTPPRVHRVRWRGSAKPPRSLPDRRGTSCSPSIPPSIVSTLTRRVSAEDDHPFLSSRPRPSRPSPAQGPKSNPRSTFLRLSSCRVDAFASTRPVPPNSIS